MTDRRAQVWISGWDAHEREQRRREATLTMIEKLAWLEQASAVAAHLRRRVRVPPPPWACGDPVTEPDHNQDR